MAFEAKATNTNIVILLKAMKLWFIMAAILSGIFSCIAFFAGLDNTFIAYASSFTSFSACLMAGASAHKARGGGAFYTGLLTAAAITIILLTIGFIIEGASMEPAGIISVASFSFAGSCVGSVFFGNRSKTQKNSSKSPKIRKKRN